MDPLRRAPGLILSSSTTGPQKGLGFRVLGLGKVQTLKDRANI